MSLISVFSTSPVLYVYSSEIRKDSRFSSPSGWPFSKRPVKLHTQRKTQDIIVCHSCIVKFKGAEAPIGDRPILHRHGKACQKALRYPKLPTPWTHMQVSPRSLSPLYSIMCCPGPSVSVPKALAGDSPTYIFTHKATLFPSLSLISTITSTVEAGHI